MYALRPAKPRPPHELFLVVWLSGKVLKHGNGRQILWHRDYHGIHGSMEIGALLSPKISTAATWQPENATARQLESVLVFLPGCHPR